MVSEQFEALVREAQFTREMLGSGATQIRKANYATKGIYFQAFTSLSTGLERIGKMCLMLDHAIEHDGRFPDSKYLRDEISHDLLLIYDKSVAIVEKRSIRMTFLERLDGPAHRAIIAILSDFALGDRYRNINLLVGKGGQSDPIEAWFRRVDEHLFNTCVGAKRKQTIRRNAAVISELMGPFTAVAHTSETGGMISDVESASFRTGMFEAVAPYRQLYVLQIVRYWVEFLYELEGIARQAGNIAVPFFGEVFAPFYNPDSYIRSRKTWDRI